MITDTLPTANTPLRRLTDEQLAFYHENGFVEVPDFMTAEELTEINAEIDRLRQEAEAQKAEGHARNNIFALGLRSDLTKRICQDERILALIERLVSPGIAIYSAKLVEKLPYDEAVCHWHQDDAYYQQNSMSPCRMSIWLPLQDCTEANGTVWMVPGSHRHGLKEYRQIEEGKFGHCKLGFAPAEADVEDAIPIEVKAGSILLFHALTWHRSLGNRTGQHRRAFIVSYQDALAEKGNGKQHKILRPA